MKVWLRIVLLCAFACGLSALTAADECQDKLAACVKANKCAQKPDSRECKACKAAYEACTAKQPELRIGAKKTTKR